jgi:hypothetical protein
MCDFLEKLEETSKNKCTFHEIFSWLKNYENSDRLRDKFLEYEELAFAFVAKDQCDGDYYVPQIAGQTEDGKDFAYPNKSMISIDMLEYWKNRASKTLSPMLRLRYLGLQVEFRPLFGEKVSGQDRFDYANSIIEATEGDLFKYPTEGFSHLNRALKMATSSKNNGYIEKVKAAYINYDLKYSSDSAPGLYSKIVCAIMNYPQAFTNDEIVKIEKCTTDRFDRLCNSEDYWSAKECSDLLVDYYGHKRKEEALGVLRKLEAKTISMNESLGAMTAQIYLHKINQHYSVLSANEDQERISVEIAQLGQFVLNSLHPIAILFDN